MRRLEQGRDSLLEYFGPGVAVHSITEADAEDYQRWLRHEAPHRRREGVKGYAEATVGKRCKDARQWFRYAVQKCVIDTNPFDAIKCASPATDRHAYIGPADAVAVMNALPDAKWRLLFALARWGGLRVISEPRAMTWADVDWGQGRLLVRSPKTEHMAGHATRVIPLFPQILEPLREVFEQAEAGQTLVLPWLSERSAAALRKPLQQAIERAGVKSWPRLWHNLRSTRQTELERQHPSHVVCAWLGNSQVVAAKHYLQVTEEDFAAALTPQKHAPEKIAAQGAAHMHGHTGSPENETALTGSGRDIDGHVVVTNDPYGVKTSTPKSILRKPLRDAAARSAAQGAATSASPGHRNSRSLEKRFTTYFRSCDQATQREVVWFLERYASLDTDGRTFLRAILDRESDRGYAG